ncbi:N-acetylglucosamine-6-phosphate deacetylase [Colwellia psychrerythraea]|uniref:N-acetylgalactosamine-6-phosphate deacetylase n=1 Tax=Colwellia psychrerythraea TaxID=28229 RepID=A0A099KKG5_COLPS|nr:N-acetylglucosamine-6-phosphate deacetylase [Colwellia psychrerythraea]KGJ90442.1 N-acetylglucosamine-6-phosphate deacetylase [Colwellia psychrerythraea]
MMQTRFHAQRLFDGQNFLDDQVLTIIDGVITDIDQNTANVDVIATGLVVPGYIDLQVNGGGGALFNDSPSVNNLKTIMAAHAKFGTTAMMPTLITDKVEVMQQAADAIAQALAEAVPGIVGVHFEGPHLSVEKKGTHCADYIRPISDAEWQVLSRQDIGQVIVTLAPETVSSDDIKRMVNLGIKVCLGHTNADYQTTQQAIDAGASGFTHLFNAMSPLQGREPGVVGAALINNNTSCGLIVDGFHVDYASCKLAIQAKPQGKVFLVTDAMPPVGTNQTQFALYDRTVYVDNGKLTSTTGELAGSSLDMASAVKNTHQGLGIALDEALRMGSLYPAEYLYQNQTTIRGELTEGKRADMVVLNDDLSVKETWISGQKV